MLNILRQNKERFIIKIILGFIIVSFAVFFGATTLQPGLRRSQAPAVVNGEDINPAKFNYILSTQMEQLKSVFKDKIPPEYETSVQMNVINTMINQELLQQELMRIGLQTSSDELADYIKQNQQFYSDGQFNYDYYKNRFLPGYQLTTGSSYEADTRQELTIQQFLSEFEDIMTLTPNEIKMLNQMDQTKFKFSVIKIPLDKNESAKEQAQKIYDQWKSKKDIKNLLKEYNLAQRDTPELQITRLNSLFGGKGELKNLKTLVSLSKENPFPENYIEEGRFIYLVKLLDIKKPDDTQTIDQKESQKFQDAYQRFISSSLQASFIKDLKDKAKIKVYATSQ